MESIALRVETEISYGRLVWDKASVSLSAHHGTQLVSGALGSVVLDEMTPVALSQGRRRLMGREWIIELRGEAGPLRLAGRLADLAIIAAVSRWAYPQDSS